MSFKRSESLYCIENKQKRSRKGFSQCYYINPKKTKSAFVRAAMQRTALQLTLPNKRKKNNKMPHAYSSYVRFQTHVKYLGRLKNLNIHQENKRKQPALFTPSNQSKSPEFTKVNLIAHQQKKVLMFLSQGSMISSSENSS